MSTPRHVVIAGGTGFLGAPLARAFAAAGWRVTVLTRRAGAAGGGSIESAAWTPDGTAGVWARMLDGADAVVNLAGESIASRRWSRAQKARLLESRILATRSLVEAIAGARTPPPVFVSASGVGYYGPHGDEPLTEDAAPGTDFIAEMAVAWEHEAERAAAPGTRVVFARTGLVVEGDGGALAPMLLPFRLGAGGRVGSGRQYWSWIHRADWVRMMTWAVENANVTGALNVTAPNPVTNAEFARALGRALHRPAILPAPAFALRLALGEMADSLILTGQRVIPDRALRLGFRFDYEQVDAALRAIFRR